MSWLWLVGALILGGALLYAAAGLDRRARRRAELEATAVPRRSVEEVDRHVPRYVTQAQVDALPPRAGDTTRPAGRRLDLGLAHPDLAAVRGTATLDAPRILLVEGMITSIRQLIRVLPGGPLLVVAGGFDDEVASTLAANRRALGADVLAVVAGPGDLIELADLVGAEVLSADDLRAGYVPASALGRAARVAADRRHTWVDVSPTTAAP